MEEIILCGIDEAGRGPLAGPLVVAGAVLHRPVAGLADSKKLTEKKREALFDLITASSHYHIVVTPHDEIDAIGLSAALARSLRQIVACIPAESYLMDGNSTFGVTGIATLVKADATIPQVSAASILAKVTRDRIMRDLAPLYPAYDFAGHKGYGTARHIAEIRINGLCPIHRRSFVVKSLLPVPSLFDYSS